ncbi:hypothetical protein AB0C98_30100 [Streptomyces sp. NPDC048558]|uniref:hypothetical protein n=1 Tax=Streptomyces sp. NPDC048558 TaxID=3155759 RepID=UPI00343AC83C
MTNTDMNLATDTASKKDKGAKESKGATENRGAKKSKTQRRAAKALAYFALIFTGLAVLAEPWLLIPVAALILAISLWD